MDLVIWSSSNIHLENVISELPKKSSVNMKVASVEVTNPDFLKKFAWMILEAKLRPQMHIVILDNNKLLLDNKTEIFKVCVCALDYILTHPMKYLIFYDLVNFRNSATMDSAMHLTHKLQMQTETLSSFARVHTHQGHPLHPNTDCNLILSHSGLVLLAQSILHLTDQVLSKLND